MEDFIVKIIETGMWIVNIQCMKLIMSTPSGSKHRDATTTHSGSSGDHTQIIRNLGDFGETNSALGSISSSIYS